MTARSVVASTMVEEARQGAPGRAWASLVTLGELGAAVAAGLVELDDAPGRCGSVDRHTDGRGSEPQVGHPQEVAPD